MDKKIDISKFDGKAHRVLSGADAGEDMRKRCELDRIDREEQQIVLEVPEDVISLNSSYFSGLFQKSLVLLGEQKFREHYQFQCTGLIRENIEDGILYILNTLNLLGGR